MPGTSPARPLANRKMWHRFAAMNDAQAQAQMQALFGALRNAAEPEVCDAIINLVRDGEDRQLCRVNAVAFAAGHNLDEEKTISGFLHASRIGLFELNWN